MLNYVAVPNVSQSVDQGAHSKLFDKKYIEKVLFLLVSCPPGEDITPIDSKKDILSLVYSRESGCYFINFRSVRKNATIKVSGSEVKAIFDYDLDKLQGPGFIIPVLERFVINSDRDPFYEDPRIVKDKLYISRCYREYPREIEDIPLFLNKIIRLYKGTIQKSIGSRIAVYEILLYKLFESFSIDECDVKGNKERMQHWVNEPDGKLAACLINYFKNDIVYKGCLDNDEVYSLKRKIVLLKSCTSEKVETPNKEVCGILYDKIHDILCSMDSEFFPYYHLYKCKDYKLKSGTSTTLTQMMLKDLDSGPRRKIFCYIFVIASCNYSNNNSCYESNCFVRKLLIFSQGKKILSFVNKMARILNYCGNQGVKLSAHTYFFSKLKELTPIMETLGMDKTGTYSAKELIESARCFITQRYGKYIELYYDYKEEIKRPIMGELILIPNIHENSAEKNEVLNLCSFCTTGINR